MNNELPGHDDHSRPAAAPGGHRAGAAPEIAGEGLVTVRPLQLQRGEPLPMNFVVLPEADGDDGPTTAAAAGAPEPPARAAAASTDALPVLTVRAGPQADRVAGAAADGSSTLCDPFAPKLGQPAHEQALHADPDSAPASITGAAGASSRRPAWRLLAVLLLLALAAAAWWWIDRHGLVWPRVAAAALSEAAG